MRFWIFWRSNGQNCRWIAPFSGLESLPQFCWLHARRELKMNGTFSMFDLSNGYVLIEEIEVLMKKDESIKSIEFIFSA